MKIFAEREAEDFLKKEGFDIIDTIFVNKKSQLQAAVNKIEFPLVIKISGRKIIHKNRIGGVKVGITNFKEATETFERFMKMKDAEGVLLQRKIHGTEYLLGVKSTREFGHIIAFGIGGVDVEKKKRITFRVCPIEKKDIEDMVKELKIPLNKKTLNVIEKNLIRLCNFVGKYPKLKELDINPLIVEKGRASVVDARMAFG